MAEYKPLDLEPNVSSLTPTPATTTINTDSGNEFEPFKSFNMIVTFNKTKLVYKPNDQLWAHFSVFSPTYKMLDEDRIGITPLYEDQFTISKNISECDVDVDLECMDADWSDEKIMARKTLFKKDNLPINDGSNDSSYFQFCYQTSDGKVLGKSTPFQFKKPEEMLESSMTFALDTTNTNDIIIDRQDEDDFIVVRSQESFLKERIEHLTKSNNLLQFLIRSMEKDLSEKNNEAGELRTELSDCKDKIELIEKSQKDVLQELELANLKKINLEEEKGKFQTILQKEQQRREDLQNEYEALTLLFAELDNNCKEAKTKAEVGQKQLSEREKEIEKYRMLINSLEDKDDEIRQLEQKVAQVSDDCKKLAEQKSNWQSSKNYMEERIMFLEKRNQELELVVQKQYEEIAELKKSNLSLKDSLNKSQSNAQGLMKQAQELILKHDKTNLDYIQMRARLEQAKIEYANLYTKCKIYQRKLARYQLIQSTDKDPTLAVNVSQLSLDSLDDKLSCSGEPEVKLNQEIPVTQQSTSDISVNKTIEKVIDDNSVVDEFIEKYVSRAETYSELNTAIKTLASEDFGDDITSLSRNIEKKSFKIPMPCTMCDQTIECHADGSEQMKEMVEHFELIHMQKMCPICSVLFDTRLPIFKTYFASHVENHLSQMKYPK